jgi:hypothetical protein
MVRVRPYFTHTHAGNRSLIPANATNHILRPLSTLKIDAGLEVYDEHGFLRAATDVARSVTGDAAAAEVASAMRRSTAAALPISGVRLDREVETAR